MYIGGGGGGGGGGSGGYVTTNRNTEVVIKTRITKQRRSFAEIRNVRKMKKITINQKYTLK